MKQYWKHILMAGLLTLTAACDFDSHENHVSAPTPTPDSHSVTLISIEMVNKDSGEELEVGGLPKSGGKLIVD